LFYRRGYFRQRLDEDDRQVERFPRNDPNRLPLELVPMAPVIELADDSGNLVPVRLGVWRARVGRVSLYLLDPKIAGNPTSAGNEVFGPELVRRNLEGLVERCGLSWDEFVALGKVEPDETGFGLTPFALRTSQYANGVPELHGAVSREMWHGLWPEKRVDEVPITSVTNGVHQRTWLSGELEGLLGDTDPQFERARELAAA